MPRYTTPPGKEDYYAEVWAMVQQIPAGRVCTYGKIAELVGAPAGMDAPAYRAFGPRWVGGAMANCPDGVPWHRVVNAKGEISERPGSERQRPLLEGEGVRFDEKGRIDLSDFGWNSP